MTENLKTDSSEINKFILDAAIKKDPVFDSYKKLCKVQENQKIDYLDFEWKYYQFYHGNRDLNIERSLDNSSSLTFSDLPIDALEVIVGNVPLIDRMVLRKVSRGLRNLVDSTEVYCKTIKLNFEKSFSEMTLENLTVKYEKKKNGCLVSWKHKRKLEKNQYYHNSMMMDDAATVLKNSKLRIGRLNVSAAKWACSTKFQRFLESLNFQLDVQSITINTNYERMHRILESLKPKTLERISICHVTGTVDDFNEAAETEQWKMATKFYANKLPYRFEMEHLSHFKNIHINRFRFTVKNLNMVRDNLLKSAHLEYCLLYYSNEYNEEGKIVRVMSKDRAYDAETRRFSIPNCRDYFQLKWEEFTQKFEMIIEKCSPN